MENIADNEWRLVYDVVQYYGVWEQIIVVLVQTGLFGRFVMVDVEVSFFIGFQGIKVYRRQNDREKSYMFCNYIRKVGMRGVGYCVLRKKCYGKEKVVFQIRRCRVQVLSRIVWG